MKKSRILIFALALSALLLQACGAANTDAVIQTAIAQTLQISQLETAAAGGGQQQAPTNTPEPGLPSDTPTITLTSTPSIPYVSVSTDTNCRTGPSQFYSYVTTINVGEQVQVLMTYNGAFYVIVRNPHGAGDCWLWLQYANQTNFTAFNLPVATQPPTPFPTATAAPSFNWAGEWNIKAVSGGSTYTGVINFTQTGNSISGSTSFNPGALPYAFSASLNSALQVASGTFSGTANGNWSAQIKTHNLNQFIGNMGATWAFCGWRSGSSAPDPCQWSP